MFISSASELVAQSRSKRPGLASPAIMQSYTASRFVPRAHDKLVGLAANVFTGPLITLIDDIRREKEQTIDHDNLDTVLRAEWEGDAKENAQNLATEFAGYLEEHRDKIEALTIFFSQHARRSEITYAMIESLFDALRTDSPNSPHPRLRAYALLDEYKGSDPANQLVLRLFSMSRFAGRYGESALRLRD